MPLQPINYGTAANDGTGDSLREALRKSQQNFEYLDQSKADAQMTAQALGSKVTAEAGKSLMTAAESAKLGSVATNASANSSDAFLLNRANHSGTQAIATVSGLQTALDGKASSISVAQAIAMAATFTAVPATYKAFLIVVTLPHVRLMQWNGAKYVRSPIGQMPGVMFHSDGPAANITHGIQVRSDVVYNTADHPDLAAFYGFAGPTFVLKEGRARVLRAADNGRGIDTALVNGYLQEDAIRNISGKTQGRTSGSLGRIFGLSEGVFEARELGANDQVLSVTGPVVDRYSDLYFDASKVVPTATENRVKTLTGTMFVTR